MRGLTQIHEEPLIPSFALDASPICFDLHLIAVRSIRFHERGDGELTGRKSNN